MTGTVPHIARRINRERLVVLGWPSAILRQIAHPLIAAGVSAHSSFREGPLASARRLRSTIRAMLWLTFGDELQREEALSRIRSVHERVRGTLEEPAGPFPAGTPYAAGDPALLLWVHATLLDSIVKTYELAVGPLAAGDRDAFCAESAATVIALGGDPAAVPRTWGALLEHIEEVHRAGTLAVTPEAHDIAAAILSPRLAGLPAPGSRTHRLITIGLLPDPVRRAYGFSWDARCARRLDRIFRLVRAARRVTPDRLAIWRHAR